MHTYRNPWYSPRGNDPQIYRTDAKPKQLGKYLVYYRIQSSNPSARCYDYVLDGVVVTQRCGGGLTEAELDAYLAEKNGDRAAHARCDEGAQSSDPASCGLLTTVAA